MSEADEQVNCSKCSEYIYECNCDRILCECCKQPIKVDELGIIKGKKMWCNSLACALAAYDG